MTTKTKCPFRFRKELKQEYKYDSVWGLPVSKRPANWTVSEPKLQWFNGKEWVDIPTVIETNEWSKYSNGDTTTQYAGYDYD